MKKSVMKLLILPDSVNPLSIIPLGYSGEKKEASNRFNEERIHYDRW